jgi:hypothetical protein
VTARHDLLQAARGLAAEGRIEFSPAELVRAAEEAGSTYPRTTLRTFILGPMCVNSPDHHAVQYGDFVRVARGRYRLVEHVDTATERTAARRQHNGSAPSSEPASYTVQPEDPQEEWHWEGNVQSAVVAHLAQDGWQIRRVADTEARQHGHDIEAIRNGHRLLVEVKGYPSERYVRGPKRGEPKRTQPALQARHWFATALLTGILMKDEHSQARVAIAFPDFETYRRLAERTVGTLGTAGIEVWLVDADGNVRAEGR